MLDLITPLILTRDEEPNIERTLGQLAWARDVVVVDSIYHWALGMRGRSIAEPLPAEPLPEAAAL